MTTGIWASIWPMVETGFFCSAAELDDLAGKLVINLKVTLKNVTNAPSSIVIQWH